MRVKIEHREFRVGWPFARKCHEVHLSVDFTHEEKQIIRQRELMDHQILERIPFGARTSDDPGWYILKVRHLIERRPDRFRLKTPVDAKQYAAQLTEVLQGLSAWLQENADPGTTLVFET